MNQADLFEDIELQTPSNTDTGVKDVIMEDAPAVTSPEWNDYVLTLFEKSEMYDGRPKCHGLRRVAELLLGQIVSSKPTKIFAPTASDEIGRATVIWEVVFSNGATFADVADSWEGNTDDAFCVFNTAIAATRAEGRALRKALRLSTVTAEEMTTKDTASITRSISQTNKVETTGEYDDSDRMTDSQSMFVDNKCKQLNINAANIFDSFGINLKRKVTKRQASTVIEKLNDYQRGVETIPEEFVGYSEDWRG